MARIRYLCTAGTEVAAEYLRALCRHPDGVQMYPFGGVYIGAPPWNEFMPQFQAKLEPEYTNVVASVLGYGIAPVAQSGLGHAMQEAGIPVPVRTQDLEFEPQTVFSAFHTPAAARNIALVLGPIHPAAMEPSENLHKYDEVLCGSVEDARLLASMGVMATPCAPEDLLNVFDMNKETENARIAR